MPRYSLKSRTRAESGLAWFSAEELTGAKLISEPTTLSALRQWVKELDTPEQGYAVSLMVGHGPDDADESERRWYVYIIDVFYTDGDVHRKLLFAVPGVGRFTPLVTKRQEQKSYRTLDTLVRQFTELFGSERDLSIWLNWEHYFVNRGIAGMVGRKEG